MNKPCAIWNADVLHNTAVTRTFIHTHTRTSLSAGLATATTIEIMRNNFKKDAIR